MSPLHVFCLFCRPKDMTIRPSKSAAPDPKFQPYRRPEPPKKEPTQSSSKQYQSQSNLSSTDTKKPSTFKKKNNNAPPPPSFKDLLKLAATKHKEKTPLNSKIPKKDDFESDRPMTQSRREEYMREQNSKLRKMGKLPPSTSSTSIKSESSRYGFTFFFDKFS